MIFYKVGTTYFLCGVVVTLLALYVVLSIAVAIMERRTEQMKQELEDLERRRAEQEDEECWM